MINAKGQTALILILLTAAALIFLAITLNWGRVAQVKSTVSIAAYQTAALLASDSASYGESEKQTSLKDTNKISALSGILMDIIMVVVTIILLIITIITFGAAAPGTAAAATAFDSMVMAAAAVAAATITLVLQASVIQPGMNRLWNKLQLNQPIQEQYFEQGISTALQGAVTDPVNITDYFDSNTNGVYGLNGVVPRDSISRFAFFYTERLKITNVAPMPQVLFFYNQLSDFMNGETCLQNYNDSLPPPKGSGLAISQDCIDPATNQDYCAAVNGAKDPNCQRMIPNGFQLNDACTDSVPGTSNYNPYCDSCCQPMEDGNGNPLRPSTCYPYLGAPGGGSYPVVCASNPNATGCNTTDLINAGLPAPTQCSSSSNPYGASYPYIYDPAYQEYANGKSFLDLMGRDVQLTPTLPLTTMTIQGNFPNGIYPLFWMMKEFSPEVDNITPASAATDQTQQHWCTTAVAPASTVYPAAYSDLNQLTFSNYTCSGQDCCVNFLPDGSATNAVGTSNPLTITVGSGMSITINSPSPGSTFNINDTLTMEATALEPAPGGITNVTFQVTQGPTVLSVSNSTLTSTPDLSTNPVSTVVTRTSTVASCDANSIAVAGSEIITATATDVNNNQITSAPVTITVINPNACSASNNCGYDGCGTTSAHSCGGCTQPQTCGALVPNMCGCKPTTTQCPAGDNCGSVVDDGCGNQIPCGPSCTSPKVCNPATGPGICQ